MIKYKVGKCVQKYGEIAEEELTEEENDDISWRQVRDMPMFVSAIYFTLKENNSGEGEPYQEIWNCLEKEYLSLHREGPDRECYRITDCAGQCSCLNEVRFRLDPVYLRLCCNTFLKFHDTGQEVVKCFFKMKYREEAVREETSPDCELEQPENILKEGWIETVLEIYGDKNRSGRIRLKRYCNEISAFLKRLADDPKHIY